MFWNVTDRNTSGHRDSMTESAQWADSVKMSFIDNVESANLSFFFFLSQHRPLGRFSLLVAMFVCVSVCVSVCAIAKHPLPEVVETSGLIAFS